MPAATRTPRWLSAWPDALAFLLGLGVARVLGWSTTDLVWSLWLSSLVVGYATIVWTIARPGLAVVRGATGVALATDPALAPARTGAAVTLGIVLAGGLFTLAFFTVHFGMFHFVHSQFLHGFFPVDGGEGAPGSAGWATYGEVVRRYWVFLPAAFLAEREGFARAATGAVRSDGAPAARRAKDAFAAPYRNVIRMHLLIFFFAAVHFARIDGFLTYAVVYAVYFFPWRELRKGGEEVVAA